MLANIIMAQGVAKFFINMSFSSIYVYSSELFPTVVRYFFISNFSALCHFPKARNKRNHTHCFILSNLNMDLPPSCPPTQLFHLFRVFFMIDNKWINKRLMDCLSDWLADQLAYRLAELQTDLLVINDQLTEWLCYWPTHRLADRLTDWLKYGLTELLALLLTDYLPERLSYWLTILLTDYLTDWLTDWLTDYLTDWFTARLSWWLTISATHLLKNRQILLAKWLTEWRLTNRRTDEPTQPVDWQTDGRIDDWRTDGLTDWRTWTDGVTGEWMTEILLWLTGHVWLLKSPWLTKMTYYLTYSLAYWLTGWMINPTSSGRNNFVPLTILLKDRLKKSGLGMVRIT